MMDADLKKRWVEALRSGKYQQAKYKLKEGDSFCCLGVLCDLQGADFDHIQREFGSLSLSENPRKYLGTVGGFGSQLSMMNDNGRSFDDIADYISANL